MIHNTINAVLVVLLVALTLYSHYGPLSTKQTHSHEPFSNYTLDQAQGGFAALPADNNPASPFTKITNSAFVSSPVQPYATSCISGPDVASCSPQDTYTCTINRHNLVECKWGGSY